MKTQSYKVLHWLQETRILGLADEESVRLAAEDWRKGGRQGNWILDVTFVDEMNQPSLMKGIPHLKACVSGGLHRIGFVGPEGTELAADMIAQYAGIDVRFFPTRDDAFQWFKSGCP